MKDKASMVIGEFRLLSESEKKVVLEEILKDGANQEEVIVAIANNIKKEIYLQHVSSNN